MGLFFHSEPDHFPNERPVGFKRYAQVLERDWKRLFLVDLLTLGSLIPFGFGLGYAVLSSSILVLIPVCILGGMIAGPGMAGMYDMILRCLRDNQDDWWHSYKKAMRQNWKAAILPGIVMCLFLGFMVFACWMLWWSTVPVSMGTILIMTASILISTMIFSIWWPQVVLFDQRHGIRIKNCILFCLQNFWRTVGTAVLQLLWWIAAVLLLPWSAFLVPLLGVWYILYVSCFLLYEQLDSAFEIEQQIGEAFPEQIPVYGED
jgi:hypothetical protein